jgi:hypothetical protein
MDDRDVAACSTGKWRAHSLDVVVPRIWPVDRVFYQFTVGCVQCKPVRAFPAATASIHLKVSDNHCPLRIQNNKHMLDASEIFRNVPKHKKESFIKLGFYILTFFYYLYRYVIART